MGGRAFPWKADPEGTMGILDDSFETIDGDEIPDFATQNFGDGLIEFSTAEDQIDMVLHG